MASSFSPRARARVHDHGGRDHARGDHGRDHGGHRGASDRGVPSGKKKMVSSQVTAA